MATKTIGQLTQATTINNADEFAIEQSGVTKRVAASVVRGDIVNANIKSDAAIAGTKLADAGITAAKLDGAQTGSAPIYGCRAWVNFDATRDSGGTVTSANTNRFIRASGNVSSVLKTATGVYTVTFSTAMTDPNYTTNVTPSDPSGGATGMASATNSSSVQVSTVRINPVALFDTNSVSVTVIR